MFMGLGEMGNEAVGVITGNVPGKDKEQGLLMMDGGVCVWMEGTNPQEIFSCSTAGRETFFSGGTQLIVVWFDKC